MESRSFTRSLRRTKKEFTGETTEEEALSIVLAGDQREADRVKSMEEKPYSIVTRASNFFLMPELM